MKRIKYTIDAIMMFMMILLLGRSVTGAQNHELIGISMIALFAMHLILNIKWFTNFKKIIRNSGNSLLNVLWLLVNCFLLLDMVIIIVSGVASSTYIFGFINLGPHRPWAFVHQASEYAGFILMSVHLGMHWKMIMGSIRKAWKLKNSTVRKVILRIVVVLIIVFGINASFRREIGDKFTYYYKDREQGTTDDYIGNLYLDYLSISAIYVAGSYYALKLIDTINKKRK